MVKLKDLVNHFKNKKNSQEKLEIKKKNMKDFDLSVEDLLEMDIKIIKKHKKMEKKFEW